MDKEKKKTLTISSDLKKKIDLTTISTSGKKSFSVEKKKPFKPILLVILLVLVVTGFSLLSQVLARMAGVY